MTRVRLALEMAAVFYANPQNYAGSLPVVLRDRGELARRALRLLGRKPRRKRA